MVDDEGIQKTPKKKAYVFRSGVAPTLAKCSSVLDCKDADLVIDKKKRTVGSEKHRYPSHLFRAAQSVP